MPETLASTTHAGFHDPVGQSQAVFRAAMDALARPGLPVDFEAALEAPMAPEMTALALALLDFETTFWLAPSLCQTPDAAAHIRFHTGARQSDASGMANFAFLDLIAGDRFEPSIFAQGTAEYPDRSTSVILRCAALSGGSVLTASGPGVSGTRAFSFIPQPDDFPACWSRNRATFPLGVDVLLVAPGQIMGLPRSTRLEAAQPKTEG
jgi:alpha-D-ribose 1-methylphosphonate 5-triphosphate synthase subunit PhnH